MTNNGKTIKDLNHLKAYCQMGNSSSSSLHTECTYNYATCHCEECEKRTASQLTYEDSLQSAIKTRNVMRSRGQLTLPSPSIETVDVNKQFTPRKTSVFV